MKKGLLVLTIILIVILGILTGMYIYKMTNIKEETPNIEIARQENIEEERSYQYLEQTNAQKEKISPNAKIVTEIYYDGCGHTVKSVNTVEDKYINLVEDELSKEFEDWKVEKFLKDEVVLSMTKKGICNEHYVVREKDGYVSVYTLDENEKERLEDITEISTQFLPSTDLEELQSGIFVYGKENLYSLLEDFE